MMQTLNDVVVNVIKAYVLNALWQAPLLWLAAELVARWMKSARAAVVHRLWAGCLMLAVVLPAAPLLRHTATAQHAATIQAQQRLIIPPSAATQSEAKTKPANATPPELPDAPQTSFEQATSLPSFEQHQAARQSPWKLIGIRLLCGVYLLSLLFAVAKLSWGLWSTARLLRRAKPTLLQPGLQHVWEQCCARAELAGVRLLSSPQVTSPSTLTFRSAVILLPAAMPECGEAEMAAALCHELAHVRRRDFLKNLAYEFAIAPLFFHPVVHAIARRVQETRELACDDMAAEMLEGRAAYASSLLRLAETMSASVAQAGRALGVFEGNVLEKRVMNLIETKVKRSGWRVVVPVVCGVLILAASCVASVRFGLRPVFAMSGKLAHLVPPAANAIHAAAENVSVAGVTLSVPVPAPAEEVSTTASDAALSEPDAPDMVPAMDWMPLTSLEPEDPQAQAPSHGQDSVTYSGQPPHYADPGDLKPLTFALGKSNFEPGDAITIDELRGTGSSAGGENLYEIKGHYTLASHDSALLAASVTTHDGSSHGGGSMNMSVDQGDGHFTLWLWKHGDGSPHLSFYPSGGGSSFASVYFVTGETMATVPVPLPGPGQTRGAPKGWTLEGNDPTNYVTGVDKGVLHDGQMSAYLQAIADNGGKFGALNQWFNAKDYLGKRVRLHGWVRSTNVTAWAGLWMRVDQGSKVVAFDNMQDRGIKGTTDWKSYDVVLDVPKKADQIALGMLLTGPGEVWMSGVKLEVVGNEVASTDMYKSNSTPDGPTNLDFGK